MIALKLKYYEMVSIIQTKYEKNYSSVEFGLSFQQIIEMKKTFEPVWDDRRTLTKGREKNTHRLFVVTELNLMDDITVSIAMYLHCFFDLSTEQKP